MGMSLACPNFDYAPMAPPLHRLGQNFGLGHIKQFVRATHALMPLAPTLEFSKMVSALLILHLLDIDSSCMDSTFNLI